MDCIECKTASPEGNHFCGRCGAELGRTLDETVRKKGFRDRQAIETEIAESVAARLMNWAGWIRNTVGAVVALFALLLGWSYLDIRAAVKAAKAETETAVAGAKKDIDAGRLATTKLGGEVSQIQEDVDGYRKVNARINRVQTELTGVQKDVLDLGNRDLKANAVKTTGPGPSALKFGRSGCPRSLLEGGYEVAYCFQGFPPVRFQVSQVSDPRPVSSLSPVGFQDASTASKPACTAANRGTFYVEKGTGNVADRPFVCVRKSDNRYDWDQLGTP